MLCFERITWAPEFDRLLSGVAPLGAAALCVARHGANQLQAADLQCLIQSFYPLQCVAVYPFRPQPAGQEDADHETRLGGTPTRPLVSRTILESSSSTGSVVSEVVVVPLDACDALAEGLARNARAERAVVSFVAGDTHVAREWGRIAYGVGWLWLCRKWIGTRPEPLIDSDGVVRSYVQLTRDGLDGVATLVWVDSDLRSGLMLLATQRRLDAAHARLQVSPEALEDRGLGARLLARGFSFDLAP